MTHQPLTDKDVTKEPDYQYAKVRLVRRRGTFEVWVNGEPLKTSGGVDVLFRKDTHTVVVARLIVEDLVIE